MTTIPLDIVETIVDILCTDPSNIPTIRACSLVCPAFIPICRKHIFASVIIEDRFKAPSSKPQTSPIQRLNCVLSTSPEIADYIRHLDLNYHVRYNGFEDESAVFTKIKSLRSLAIRYSFGNSIHAWNDSPMRTVLLHLFRLPSLTKLILRGLNLFVLTDLAACVNLEDLEIRNVTTTSPSHYDFQYPPVRLRKLLCMYNGSVRRNMNVARRADGSPFIDVKGVTDLTLDITYDDAVKASPDLASRCRQLVNVKLYVSSASLEGVNLSQLLGASMKTLKNISICADYIDGDGEDPLCGITNALGQLNKENIIEDLTITIIILAGLFEMQENAWSHLDRMLAESAWPKLRRVSLTVLVDPDARLDAVRALDDYFPKLPETQFHWLLANKSLTFEFEARLEEASDIYPYV
ncbi:hypothetical protein BDN70DRAFT_916944 [Pholiota conissans]|uniref:Uncharacterized protein n=1 Tax=Pholiota conissans TaxID=109636 RepID=A0A9P5ZFM9_9AGAR|nr:hypothetical protein BDN70DRAFT_916944 [Pholiota conissans]